jgi:YVTN family beta-propeller protein
MASPPASTCAPQGNSLKVFAVSDRCRPRRILGFAGVVGLTALLLLVSLSPALPASGPSNRSSPGRYPEVPFSLRPSSHLLPARAMTTSQKPLRVTDTLVLFNNTLVPGNFPAGNGNWPFTSVYDSVTGEIFVGDSDSNNISVISDATNSVVSTIPSGTPYGLAYDTGKGEIFASNNGANDVNVISDLTNKVVASIPIGGPSSGIVYDHAMGEVFVANDGGSSIVVINDTNDTVVASIPVGSCQPGELAYDSGSGEIFVTCGALDTVQVISDTNNSIVTKVNVSGWSYDAVYDSAKGEVFVSANALSVISNANNSIVAQIPIGAAGLTYDSSKGEIFATVGLDKVVAVSDADNSEVASITVGSDPLAATYDSSKGEIFVPNSASDNVSVIADRSNTIVATISVGSEPWGLAYDGRTQELLLANPSGADSVINATSNSIITNVETGQIPQQVAYDSGKGEMFVSDAATDNVTVISDQTDQVVTNIPVAGSPFGIAYDGGRSEVFVADLHSASLTVISDLNDSVIATIPVGDFPESVVYDDVANEIFVAYANSNNVSVISDSTNSVVSTIVMAGTEASSPPNFWGVGMACDSATGEVVVPTPWSGMVYVISDVSNSVVASIQVGDEGSYSSDIAFDNATGDIFVTNNVTDNVTVISMSNYSVIDRIGVGGGPWYDAFDPSNGDIYVSNEYQGTLSIIYGGKPKVLSTVIFRELGLPSGATWSATVNSTSQESSTELLPFAEPNGTYSFVIGSVADYSPDPASGSFLVAGAPILINVTFSSGSISAVYPVSLIETGLPTSTSWAGQLGGMWATSTTTTNAFTEPNGTYSVIVGQIGGYSVSYASSIKVEGGPVIVNVTFSSATFPVTFTESGLVTSGLWLVSATNLANQVVVSSPSTMPSVTLHLPDGTYGLSASGPIGYRVAISTPTVTINGSSPPAVTAVFSAAPPGTVASSSILWVTEAVLVVIAVVGAFGAGWGYTSYRYTRAKTEALGWVQEFHEEVADMHRQPPR